MREESAVSGGPSAATLPPKDFKSEEPAGTPESLPVKPQEVCISIVVGAAT